VPEDTAVAGKSALDWLVKTEPVLAVLDWRLPDCFADVVADELRARHGSEVPVILISAERR
jgi:DNA-binding response OmpR family regulator